MPFDVNILNNIFRYAVVIHTINTDTETHMGMFANIVDTRPPLCTTYDVRSVRTRTGIELYYTSAMFSIFSETPCNAFVICANVHSLYGRCRYDTQPHTTCVVNVCVSASICWHSDVLPPIGHSYHFEQIKEQKKTETNLWNFSSLLPSNEPCIVLRFSIMCSCVCVIYSNSDEKPHNSLSGSWRVSLKNANFTSNESNICFSQRPSDYSPIASRLDETKTQKFISTRTRYIQLSNCCPYAIQTRNIVFYIKIRCNVRACEWMKDKHCEAIRCTVKLRIRRMWRLVKVQLFT